MRLDVGEWAVALNICEALGSLKGNLSSKPVGWATGLPTTICLMGLVGNCWGDDFQAAFWGGANGWAAVGCRGLPLLVVGGETPALAKDKACFEAA